MKRQAALALALSAALASQDRAALTTAPEITLPDLKGAKVRLDYKSSRLTLVNFWATWCLPCRDEMPQIAKLVDKFGAQGFRAVGIAVESGEAADVKSFLGENPELGINYPILIGDDGTLARFGDVQVVPTTFLIDPGGKVVRMLLGVTRGFSRKVEEEIRRSMAPPAEQEKRPSGGPQTAPGKRP